MSYPYLQVATQFSTGTGLYLPEYRLVVTSEHVVSGTASVVISDTSMADRLATIVYLDQVHDLALLRTHEELQLPQPSPVEVAEFLVKTGLAPTLTYARLLEQLVAFSVGGGRRAARCFNCERLIFEDPLNPRGHCPHCGEAITLPSMVSDPVPTGISATLEQIVTRAGYDPRLARRGPYLWSILRGSATIQLAYHEDSGLVTGDAYLCQLPEMPTAELFAYLLRENHRLRELTFSTYGRDIVLSLLIYDRYLTLETALPHFEHLFERADAYDDVLVERFGADWQIN